MGTRQCLIALAVLGGCTEYEYAELRFNDVFHQVDEQVAADVLFVMDDSASMAEEQAQLALNFAEFLQVMTDSDADYQLGVVTTDAEREDAGVLRGGVLTPDSYNLLNSALEALTVGTQGSRDERGLEVALRAVTGDRNPGFVRDGAKLNIVVFSDEDDHSPYDVNSYLTNFAELADEDPFSVHAVVGDLPDGCASGRSAAASGDRYLTATALTGGYIDSICADDYTGILTRVGLDAAGLNDTFYLSMVPELGTVEVWVDTVQIPERDVDGWTYSLGENAIIFHGRSVPRPGMKIGVNYEQLMGGQTGLTE
jgi:hypothetical protein